MISLDERRSVLTALGASLPVADELLAYNENVFRRPEPLVEAMDALGTAAYPDEPFVEAVDTLKDRTYPDEPFVEAWRGYAVDAGEVGAFESLRHRLVQFRFPIEDGISRSEAYQRAIRRGELPEGGFFSGGLGLREGPSLRLEIHGSPAGHIPLLITTCRDDFVTLVRALTRKNEPDRVPDSMGACMVAGYSNWDRIRTYREAWECRHPDHTAWSEEFRRMLATKDLYQDRFILLSDGFYSAVPPEALGLTEDVWRTYSLIIRREHECAHYYTRRVLGSMRNNLLDEIIADCMGILEIHGRFRAAWFLTFMGLEEFPRYRAGGRFENYVGGLSEEAVPVLRRLVFEAAQNLERTGPRYRFVRVPIAEKVRVLNGLTAVTLEEMAFGGTLVAGATTRVWARRSSSPATPSARHQI